MRDDACETRPQGRVEEEEEARAWANAEAQAIAELGAAQQRLDAVRALRRVYLTHAKPTSLLRAAEAVVEQYPTIGGAA